MQSVEGVLKMIKSDQKKLLNMLGRNDMLFQRDLNKFEDEINDTVSASSFLVIGGGGSIGRAVVKELFKRGAKLLHVVDLSENNLVELVRSVRSEYGYVTQNFDTFALDCGDSDFVSFMRQTKYDYILNLSAMKHVRSESNAFAMKRMLKTNVLNTLTTFEIANEINCKKYFCVSTDKAANPANFMGATKRIMEHAVMRLGSQCPVSMARFANVAFSDGSLLDGFRNRLKLKQPITAPTDIERFFLTEDEAGVICLLSTLFGLENQIAVPLATKELRLTSFKDILFRYLQTNGYKAQICRTEDEARHWFSHNKLNDVWPIYLFESDTTGEKSFEEFYTKDENVLTTKFEELAFVQFEPSFNIEEFKGALDELMNVDLSSASARQRMIRIAESIIGEFSHVERNKFLNSRM